MDQAVVELLKEATKGNAEAERFLVDVLRLVQFFDDVADQDKKVSRTDVEDVLWTTLGLLPRNSFYTSHFEALNTLVMTSILNWSIATDFERDEPESQDDLRIAFVIRSNYVDIISMVAMICGGLVHARAICKKARLLVHAEGWEEYLNALNQEKQARG